MKIGIDIRVVGKNRTGDETYTRELVKNLLKIDRRNDYFLYTDTADSGHLNKIKKILETGKSRNVRIVPVLPASKALWTFWSLPLHINKNPVDILHVQYITPLFISNKTKLITTIHDVSFKEYSKMIKKSDLLFLKTLIPVSLKRADKIIAVSEFTKQEIIRHYHTKEEKVEMVYNGGASEQYNQRYSYIEVKKSAKRYGIDSNYVLYVGTLQPRKNIPFLIEAFLYFKEKNKDQEFTRNLKLVISGIRNSHNYDLKINSALQKAGKRADDVIFTGYINQDDLPLVLQGAKVFVFPSLYEGFGLPLLEAMASGVSVLSADSPCSGEISAGAAQIYKQGNKKDFTNQLSKLMLNESLKQNLQKKGQERARDFSWEECAKKTLEAYLKTAG